MQLSPADAATYAEWFACLADPTRVRLLHAVAVAGRAVPVGELAEQVGISQSTCSHHIRKLADVGFVVLRKEKTATLVTVNAACCTGLPHAADAVMGMLGPRPCCPEDLPADVTVRALERRDWAAVRRIYAEGIATGNATFETEVPDRRALDHDVAARPPVGRRDRRSGRRLGGRQADLEPDPSTAGSPRPRSMSAMATAAEGSGKRSSTDRSPPLTRGSVDPADPIFPENRASIALHQSAGYRTLGVRERIGQHHGVLARHRLPRTAPGRLTRPLWLSPHPD